MLLILLLLLLILLVFLLLHFLRFLDAMFRSAISSYMSSTLDSSLASNIQKLFSEKVDYFAPVQPSRVSVLTAIIKLGLKTLLECVRINTFARYGLQQMQVPPCSRHLHNSHA